MCDKLPVVTGLYNNRESHIVRFMMGKLKLKTAGYI